MAARRGGFRWVLFTAVAVLAFFSAIAQLTGWSALQLRRFSIPVAGGPHLSTADEWRSELDLLVGDISKFWRAELAAAGHAFERPALIAPMEGSRPVCGGAIATGATVFCIESNTLELHRISLNGASRVGAGRGHMAVAYTVARLAARSVQKSLGADLNGGDGAPRRDAQAECLAGVWLRAVPARYGVVRKSDLAAILRAARVSAPDPAPMPEGVLMEEFSALDSADRLKALTRGFEAGRLQGCLD